jgi:hypothetical protein
MTTKWGNGGMGQIQAQAKWNEGALHPDLFV